MLPVTGFSPGFSHIAATGITLIGQDVLEPAHPAAGLHHPPLQLTLRTVVVIRSRHRPRAYTRDPFFPVVLHVQASAADN